MGLALPAFDIDSHNPRLCKMNTFYNTYARDVHSQNGEDGIIEELLKRLEISGGWVCEFGAWDGIYLSNTFNLIKSRKFSGVYIEGDAEKYKDLLRTCATYDNIVPVNRFVDHNKSSSDSLDNILRETPIPIDFDILSIDIDSFDYHVWESLEVYRPKIVIIEINSSIRPDNEIHIHKPDVYQGTGYLPTYKLGLSKGYTFALHTGNMFFIRNDLFDKAGIHYSNPLENFRSLWVRW